MRARVPLVVLAGLLVAGRARADGSETDRQIAETLFEQGRALMEEKKYAEACAKFAESQRLDRALGTLLNLAVCHELEGRTATAQTEFKEGLAEAAREGQTDREELAREHLAAIEKRLVRIVVVVPDPLAGRGPVVMLDRSTLAPAAWGVAIAVDPGEHRVVVDAPRATRWETVVDARDEGRTYRVEVPPLEPERPLPRPRTERVRSGAFWWVLGGGALVFTGGVVSGIVALDADAYVDSSCSATRDFCRVDDAGAAADRARTFAWVSTGAIALGAAAVFTAFLLPKETRVLPTGIRF